MAFCTAFQKITDGNIRNIYGGLPSEVRFRVPNSTRYAITPAQRYHEQQRRPSSRQRFLDQRYYEYDEENHIRLPRAPAFRMMPKAKVDTLVTRLSRPTIRRNTTDVCPREVDRSFKETCPKCIRRGRREVTFTNREELDALTDRLLIPTAAANVRKSLRCKQDFDASLVHSCSRCHEALSRRFARDLNEIINKGNIDIRC